MTADTHILTPQMLRDRATHHQQCAAACHLDGLYTDSWQAQESCEEAASWHRSEARRLLAEAEKLDTALVNAWLQETIGAS
jgi:hypothetical protein